MRDLRQIADGAKADLRKGLGPEFSDLDLDDLNPRRFVQKHLLSDLNRDDPDRTEGSGKAPATALAAARSRPTTPKPPSAGPGKRRRSPLVLAPGNTEASFPG